MRTLRIVPPEVRSLHLPDGRDLAWYEIGSEPETPVLAFHGSPGTGAAFARHEAASIGYRLIAPDRPGYGHSSYDPRRSFASWIADVALLVDHLGLQEFAVMGVSSGGPNAAACARFLPDRLLGCAIVSGPAPPGAGISDDGMLLANRVGRRLLRMAPRVMPHLLAPVATLFLRVGQRNPERAIAYLERTLPPADAAVVARDEVRGALMRDFARPIARKAGAAAVQDFVLEVNDWGFRLEDIGVRVDVWHGDEDRNVPIVNGIRLAEAIPGATLHRITGSGHWLIHDQVGAILRLLAP